MTNHSLACLPLLLFDKLMDGGGSRSEFALLVYYNYDYVIVTDVLLGEVECKCKCNCNIFVTCIMTKSSSVCEHFTVSESAVGNLKAKCVLNVNTKAVIESVIVIDPKSASHHSNAVINHNYYDLYLYLVLFDIVYWYTML